MRGSPPLPHVEACLFFVLSHMLGRHRNSFVWCVQIQSTVNCISCSQLTMYKSSRRREEENEGEWSCFPQNLFLEPLVFPMSLDELILPRESGGCCRAHGFVVGLLHLPFPCGYAVVQKLVTLSWITQCTTAAWLPKLFLNNSHNIPARW